MAETLVEDVNQRLSLIVTTMPGKNLSRSVVKQLLKNLVSVNEINGIAQLLPSLEWCVSVKSAKTLQALLRVRTVKDNEGNEIYFKKTVNELFGKIGGLPIQIPNSLVYRFLRNYGLVVSLRREYELDEGVRIFTGPRKFTLELYKNLAKEDIPQVAKIGGVVAYIMVYERHICSVLCRRSCSKKQEVAKVCPENTELAKNPEKLPENIVYHSVEDEMIPNLPVSLNETVASEKSLVRRLHECSLLHFHAELRKHSDQLSVLLCKYKVKAIRKFISEHSIQFARKKIIRVPVSQYFEFYGFESLPEKVVNIMLQLKSVYDHLVEL